MKDEYGRTNNTSQAIRSLDKLRMAYLFDDMKKNPNKYPVDIEGWLEWLNKDSGDDIYEI